MSVVYRTREETVGETGVGVADRVTVVHEIGTKIDGVFVPFATIGADRVEVLARAEADRLEAAKAAKQKPSGDKSTTGA